MFRGDEIPFFNHPFEFCQSKKSRFEYYNQVPILNYQIFI